jgi:hypothetical protein
MERISDIEQMRQHLSNPAEQSGGGHGAMLGTGTQSLDANMGAPFDTEPALPQTAPELAGPHDPTLIWPFAPNPSLWLDPTRLDVGGDAASEGLLPRTGEGLDSTSLWQDTSNIYQFYNDEDFPLTGLVDTDWAELERQIHGHYH